MEQAERYKAQGNQALQAGMYSDAIDLYSKAIALEPSEAVYFSNRCAAYAALKRWREALDDAHEVVTLRPDWAKGWVRRGSAFTGLGQHEEARKAYAKALKFEPANAQIEGYLKAAEKAVAEGKEKKWEDDLWSDDDEDGDGGGGNGGGGGGSAGAKAAAASSSAGSKRAAAAEGDDDDGFAGVGGGAKRARRKKPGAALAAQLDRSLKDASEDSLRACLGQIALADEDLCERALHILEGLNAASSAGEDDDEEDDDAGKGGAGGVAEWLRGGGGAGGGGKKRMRRDDDSD